MKKTIMISILICLVSYSATAQLGITDSEEDLQEKERINNDPHQSSRAHVAGTQSLWSMSYSNDPSTWKRPEYDANSGWQAKTFSAPISQIVVTAPSQPKAKGKDISQLNAESRRRQVDMVVRCQRRQREMREAARRRAEAERRRKEAENRQDFQRGYQSHRVNTSDYYQQRAAKDEWLHSEGVRRLEELDVMDWANVPEETPPEPVKTKSGDQLANLLKDDNRHVQVVIVEAPNEERKTGVSLNDQGNSYNLIDNGRVYDIDEWTWEAAITGDPFVAETPSKDCFGVEEEVLIDGKTLELDSFCVSTLPYSGCVIFLEDSVMFVDNNVHFPGLQAMPASITKMVVCGQRLFGKSQNQIVEIKGNNAIPLCSFETEQFDIFHDTDSTLLLLSNTWEVSVVARINVERSSLDEIARTAYNVRKVISTGNDILVLVDNCIMNISDGLSLIYCNDEESINDICLCKEGLLVASNTNVILLKNNAASCQFLPSGVIRLWFDLEDIYAINTNKDLVKYNIK